MSNKVAFILAASVQGAAMILNRFDYDTEKKERGVGLDLLEDGERCTGMGVIVARLALARRQSHGDGLVLIDGGANIGTFTIPWARLMHDWGRVIAFEPQQWPYYALCGNIALNNCFNAEARRQALSHCLGSIGVPFYHPLEPHNAGSVRLGEGEHVQTVTIDSLNLDRLDILKLDLEGMEPDALAGARQTIARCKPIIIAEGMICGPGRIADAVPDYAIVSIGPDLLCVPGTEENGQLIGAMMELAKQLNMQAA